MRSIASRRMVPLPLAGVSFETPRIARLLRTRRVGRRDERRPKVAVDVLAPVAVDTAYSYRAPSDWKLEPGACVRMPLGARLATGVVWAVRPAGGDNLKSVAATLDWPPLRPPLRDFIDWVARWTLSPRGMVLQDGDPRRRSRGAAGAEIRPCRDRQSAGADDRRAGASHGGGRRARRANGRKRRSRRLPAHRPASSTVWSPTARSSRSRCRRRRSRRRSTLISA